MTPVNIWVTNKKHLLEHCYHLQREQIIKSVTYVKYLGAEHLLFNEHIKVITNKANHVNAKEHWYMY